MFQENYKILIHIYIYIYTHKQINFNHFLKSNKLTGFGLPGSPGLPYVVCFNIWPKRRSPHPQHSSSLIYSFTCVCGLQYIGRTNQRPYSRIKQHIPTKIRQGNYFADRMNNTYGSSTAENLINNRKCASSYNADLFTI